MKFKALILLLCGVNLAFGIADKNTLNQTLKNNKILGSIQEVRELDSGLSMVIVSIEKKSIPFLATNDGKIIFQPEAFIASESIRAKVGQFYQEVTQKDKIRQDKELKTLLDSKKNLVFYFTSDKKTNSTIYIVSDPNCPYCQQEFENLNSKLKDSNVIMAVVGFLGEDSLNKASFALANKSNDEKKNLNLLKQLYTKGYKLPNDSGKSRLKDINLLNQSIVDIGITSVPYIAK